MTHSSLLIVQYLTELTEPKINIIPLSARQFKQNSQVIWKVYFFHYNTSPSASFEKGIYSFHVLEFRDRYNLEKKNISC